MSQAQRATESEKLINELETIYLVDGWREIFDKAARVKVIKRRLGQLLGGAR